MQQKANPPSASDWVIRSATPGSVERIQAWFNSHGYHPHRHDIYSIGRTLAGVRSFHDRGALCHGVPGNTLMLHPDEVHDGMAGTDIGFRYRMAYIDSSLSQNVLGGEPLPFIVGGCPATAPLLRQRGLCAGSGSSAGNTRGASEQPNGRMAGSKLRTKESPLLGGQGSFYHT